MRTVRAWVKDGRVTIECASLPEGAALDVVMPDAEDLCEDPPWDLWGELYGDVVVAEDTLARFLTLLP